MKHFYTKQSSMTVLFYTILWKTFDSVVGHLFACHWALVTCAHRHIYLNIMGIETSKNGTELQKFMWSKTMIGMFFESLSSLARCNN